MLRSINSVEELTGARLENGLKPDELFQACRTKPSPDPLPKVIIYLTHQLYPLCLFVIPDSCDFVVWFPFIHRQSKPRRNTNTKPIHTKAASRMSQVCYCPPKGRGR